MLRRPNLLTAGVLLLSMMSIGASALPLTEGSAGKSSVQQAQYSDDGGRCFNRCVRGRIFRRCQADTSVRQNCCNVACTRLNNGYY